VATILVVDDNAVNRKVLVAMLSGDGHLTLEAVDGLDGLRVARAQRPQLVISDILMPSMDGYDFVRALRQDPQLHGMPVIFYTANYHEREAHRLAQACGVNKVLIKPCPRSELLKAVEQVMGGVSESAPRQLPENFDREHVRLLTDKLSERAIALAASNDRFVALAELNLEIAFERNMHQLLERACSGARSLIGSRFAFAAVTNDAPTHEILSATSGVDADNLTPPDLRSGPLGGVVSGRVPWRHASADGQPVQAGLPAEYPAASAFIGVPIMTPKRAYGWLCLADKVGAPGFDGDDERLLLTLGALVGRTYEGIRLHTEVQNQSAQLNRAYTLLSGINRLVMRGRGRDELCAEVCQLCVTRGRYRLAYIDVLDPDGTPTCIASAGDAPDMKQFAERKSRDAMPINDLLGAPFKSHQAAVCNDLADTYAPVRLRTELLASGYRAVAAVPLGDEDETLGRLVLLVDTPGFFDEEEMRLLGELAASLSFALAEAQNA
jgi:CheY-like chemotaxis protein/GAF domain-containing protein